MAGDKAEAKPAANGEAKPAAAEQRPQPQLQAVEEDNFEEFECGQCKL
jgi:hypothetical protein